MTLTRGRGSGNPAPLVTAASLVAVEGTLLFLFGVVELVNLSGDRLTLGLTTALFFAAYGAGLVWCGWVVTRRPDPVAWTRGPIVLAQLIQLGLAFNFRGGGTTLVAVFVAVVALVVIAGMVHPSTTAALDQDPERES